MLLLVVITASPAYAEVNKLEIYDGYRFSLGVGAAIVRFDTKLKFTDKQSGNSAFLDPEGNLDLPDTPSVTTLYGSYNFNQKHSIGFSYFSVNRESSVFGIDKTFEDIRVVGDATMSDTTKFYRLERSGPVCLNNDIQFTSGYATTSYAAS